MRFMLNVSAYVPYVRLYTVSWLRIVNKTKIFYINKVEESFLLTFAARKKYNATEYAKELSDSGVARKGKDY